MILLFIVFASSCETEEPLKTDDLAKSQIKKRLITLNELQKNTIAFSKFEDVKNNIIENNSLSSAQEVVASRLTYFSQYNFYIDTNKIMMIEEGDYKSYSFPIYRYDEITKTENLVITQKNGEANAYVSKYTLTEIEKEKIQNNEYVDVINKTEILKLEIQSGQPPCYDIISVPYSWNSIGQVTASIFALVEVPCPEPGNTTGPGGGDPGGTSSGAVTPTPLWSFINNPIYSVPGSGYTPGGGGGPSSPDEPAPPQDYEVSDVVTTPVLNIDNFEIIRQINFFYQSLSPEQLQWANENSSLSNQLIQHLIENNWNDESKQLAEELMDYAEQYSNESNQLLISQIIEIAINDLRNGKDCVILPTVINPSDILAPFDSNVFGDYSAPIVQQNHDAIQQQFNNLRTTSGNLAAVNYLINTYNMRTFATNTVTFNYSITFGDGLPTGDSANTFIVYNNGVMTSCNLAIDTNLFSYLDFGYITRVIKHELYHVLQGEFYGQNGLSNAAREFDAYNSQIFRFNDLKKIEDMSLIIGLAKKMIENMKLMTNLEKTIREDKIEIVQQTFPELCKD